MLVKKRYMDDAHFMDTTNHDRLITGPAWRAIPVVVKSFFSQKTATQPATEDHENVLCYNYKMEILPSTSGTVIKIHGYVMLRHGFWLREHQSFCGRPLDATFDHFQPEKDCAGTWWSFDLCGAVSGLWSSQRLFVGRLKIDQLRQVVVMDKGNPPTRSAYSIVSVKKAISTSLL